MDEDTAVPTRGRQISDFARNGFPHAGAAAPERLGSYNPAMHESWPTRLRRWAFNWFPAYRGTGARITFIASDYSEIRIRIPLNWRTRNYVGTIFGGSMFAATDPMYMIMLIHMLGPGYVVWDKSGAIRFLKPGRETLYATFHLDREEVEAIRAAVDANGRIEREFTMDLVNASGEVHASATKLISIRKNQKVAGGV